MKLAVAEPKVELEAGGPQDQMRRQACRQQGWRGQQPTATGNGIDETGNERDNSKDSEGSEVNAEFKGME